MIDIHEGVMNLFDKIQNGIVSSENLMYETLYKQGFEDSAELCRIIIQRELTHLLEHDPPDLPVKYWCRNGHVFEKIKLIKSAAEWWFVCPTCKAKAILCGDMGFKK